MPNPVIGLAVLVAAFQGNAMPAAPIPTATPAQVRAVRLTQPISVDGELSESVWQAEQAVTAFAQRDPKEGGAPTERTAVYLAYDNDAVYVAARLYDAAPDSVVARLARRDVDVSADRFTVFIDSYHDGRSGFYFEIGRASCRERV